MEQRDGTHLPEATQIQPRRARLEELRSEVEIPDERTRRIRRDGREPSVSVNEETRLVKGQPAAEASESFDEATRRQQRTSVEPVAAPVRRRRGNAPRTTVITSATRVAYDPGRQGVAAAQYPVRGETLLIPARHVDVSAPVSTARRTPDMPLIQSKLRRQLMSVTFGAIAVTGVAVLALIALVGGI